MRTTLKKYQNILIIIGVAVVAFVLGLLSGGFIGGTEANFAGAAGGMAEPGSCKFFDPADTEPTGIVLADPLNFRIGPGLDYSIITSLDYCTKVELKGRTEDSAWLLVQADGNVEGWVFAYYIKPNTDISSLDISTGFGGPDTTGGASGQRNVSVVIQLNQAVAIVTGMPADAETVAILSPQNGDPDKSLVVASGWTDSLGNVTLSFSMPTTWADGSTLESGKMTLKIKTNDVSMDATITYYN